MGRLLPRELQRSPFPERLRVGNEGDKDDDAGFTQLDAIIPAQGGDTIAHHAEPPTRPTTLSGQEGKALALKARAKITTPGQPGSPATQRPVKEKTIALHLSIGRWLYII